MTDTVQQLIDAMQQELQFQQDLAALLDHKLDAMRHYDISRMEALGISEQRLVDRLRSHEQQRTEAIRRATRQYFPARFRQVATCREIAQVIAEPSRSKLLTLAAMLKDVAQNVQRLHRVQTLASRKIMAHFNQIFRIIAQSGRDVGLYGRGGKKALLEQNRLVDALA